MEERQKIDINFLINLYPNNLFNNKITLMCRKSDDDGPLTTKCSTEFKSGFLKDYDKTLI